MAKALPKAVVRLGWVSLLTDVASDMVYPLLPALLASLGAGGIGLGFVEGVGESTAALVKWRAGALSDRTSKRKPLVVIGYLVASVARPFFAVATAAWHVVFLRALDRTGKGIRTAPRDALLVSATSPERRAMAFGFHRMMDNTGAIIGPLLAFGLATFANVGMKSIFVLSIIPSLLAVLVLALGVSESKSDPKTDAEKAVTTPLSSNARRYLAAVLFFSLGASADSFLLLRMNRLGLAAEILPIVWLTLNAAKAMANVPGGYLADRFGRKGAIGMGWVLYAIVYASIPFFESITLTWIAILVYGLYYGLTEGAEKAMLAELVPKSSIGRGYGLLSAIVGLAVLPANALFGVLFDKHLRLAFSIAAGFAMAGAVLLLTVNVPARHKDA